MRLSDAIALGRTLQKGGTGWSFCDCALGLAQAAVGIPFQERHASTAVKLWPWLAPNGDYFGVSAPLNKVSDRYFSVAKGEMTLDQLIDWVRSVEPEEILEVAHAEIANGDRAEVNT